jgi:hypothetical protein
MVKYRVLFEVRAKFLNIIEMSFGWTGSSAGTPDDPIHRQLRVIPTLDQIENPHDALTTARTRTTTKETCCVVLYCIVLYCIVLYCIALYYLSIKQRHTY